MGWPEIKAAYAAHFPNETREGLQGLQCKYYRVRDNRYVPKERERKKSVTDRAKYGLRAINPERRYLWMRPLAFRKFDRHEAERRLEPWRRVKGVL
jgi:hypothetical protein